MREQEIVKEFEKMGLQAAWTDVSKNGILHRGLIVASDGQVAPIIYTAGLVDAWDSVDVAVRKIFREYQKVKAVSLDVERMTSREYILEHITVAVQKNGIEDIVKRVSGFEGIEAYLVMMDGSLCRDGSMTMKVRADLLEQRGISEAEAWMQAEKNLHDAVQIESMYEVMKRIAGDELVEACGIDDAMYVISNKSGVKGASAVLDKEIMKAFAKEHCTKRIAVLPSSIHEMLLIPHADNWEESELSSMVREVNLTEVVPEERLTDRVYFLEF